MTPILHAQTKGQLEAALHNPSAVYIFTGKQQSGKLAAALALARQLTTSDLDTNQYIFRIIPTTRKRVGIADIQALLRSLQLKTLGNEQYRAVVIDRANAMSIEAANALLRILEEPPEKTVFILNSESISQLLPTIRSRAQVIRFLPIEKSQLDTVFDHIDEPDRQVLVRIAAGRAGFIQQLVENPADREVILEDNAKANLYLTGNLNQRFLIAKIVVDQKKTHQFITMLYCIIESRYELIDCLPAVFAAEQQMNANLNARLVLENLALELA